MKVPFDSAFIDVTREVAKIPKQEYLKEGKYPIIDQGDSKIAGYTNRENGVYRNGPVVLFGDHTRVFKYIDFPFFAGADGTKILKAKAGTDTRFGYYSLINHPLNSLGYSRHFKLLKDKPFHTHDYTTQLRIAGVLGSLDEKIELNRKKIAELEALAKTVYDYWFVQFDFPDANGKPYKSSGGKMIWNDQLKREVPEGWEVQPLGALVDTKVQPSIPVMSTVPYVTTENLMPNMSGYQREERCVSSIIGGHNFFPKDTLVSNIRPYFQKLWYADTYGVASSDVIRFHAKECPALLFFALARSDFFAYMMKGAKGSKMPRGDKAHIARYVLSWGNDSIRNKSVAIFQPILERCNLLVAEISYLEHLRDTLLPLLMNGQVDVG